MFDDEALNELGEKYLIPAYKSEISNLEDELKIINQNIELTKLAIGNYTLEIAHINESMPVMDLTIETSEKIVEIDKQLKDKIKEENEDINNIDEVSIAKNIKNNSIQELAKLKENLFKKQSKLETYKKRKKELEEQIQKLKKNRRITT